MLKIGKVPPEILKQFVYPFLGKKRKEVLVHSGLGEDCSIVDFGQNVAVISCDPITGADKNSGYLSVFVACNDIAACGAEPIGILTIILLPKDSNENDLKEIMEGIHRAGNRIDIEVLGGHSEITDTVVKPIIAVTSFGIAKKDEYITSSGARVGDDVIVTKALGLEGSAILAFDFEELLKKHIPSEQIKKAQSFMENISVINEGLIAAKIGATAMHDITEGGLLGAVFEVTEASEVGIEIFKDKLPILPETKAICNVFNIDPLGLISSGSMLICTPKGEETVAALKSKNIPAHIIGKIIENGKYIIADNKSYPIVPPERDELYTAIERAEKL